MRRTSLAVLAAALVAVSACAKVDLVTLPARDTVQLTIYNSADLTLVRESRALTLQTGTNRLQFSWANTLIDPTSLDLLPKAQADRIVIEDLVYPPRVQNLGLWTINSRVSGPVPVEINYLTSGLSWRAFYFGTLSPDEQTMRLEGFVRVLNMSGEDYENAQTRLIVGQVHLIDQIAELARRQYPYGAPIGDVELGRPSVGFEEVQVVRSPMLVKNALFGLGGAMADSKPKEVVKEGLSEYFLYTIEGTETIRNGWSKRLPSFSADGVPVVNLYKFEEERYGNQVIRFLSFKNDKKHKLGETPIPGGTLKVFRALDAAQHLSYAGQSEFKYIPVDEDVELSLGAVETIVVEPKLMNTRTQNFSFNRDGNIDGWEQVDDVRIDVKNTLALPVKVAITRNFPGAKWDVIPAGDAGTFEKVDLDTVKFTLELKPRSKQVLTYALTTRFGRRAD